MPLCGYDHTVRGDLYTKCTTDDETSCPVNRRGSAPSSSSYAATSAARGLYGPMSKFLGSHPPHVNALTPFWIVPKSMLVSAHVVEDSMACWSDAPSLPHIAGRSPG